MTRGWRWPLTGAAVLATLGLLRLVAGPQAPLTPPPGAERVGGVSLIPTDRVLMDQCRQAADWLGYPVPCPGLMPGQDPGAGPLRCGGEGTDPFTRGCVLTNLLPRERPSLFLLREKAVAVPPGDGGEGPTATSAVQLEAYPPALGRSAAGGSLMPCFPAHVESVARVGSLREVFLRCGWVASATLLLQLTRPATPATPIVEISVSGPLAVDHRLLTVIAEHVRMVGPDES